MRKMPILSLACLLIGSFGCGTTDDPGFQNDAGGAPPPVCRKGGWTECACPGGYRSAAICLDDGSYGQCLCGPSPGLDASPAPSADAAAAKPVCEYEGQVPDALKAMLCYPKGRSLPGTFVCQSSNGSLAPVCLDLTPPIPDAAAGPEAGPPADAPPPDVQPDSAPDAPAPQADSAPDAKSEADLPAPYPDAAPPAIDAPAAPDAAAVDAAPAAGCGPTNLVLPGFCFDDKTQRYGFPVCYEGAQKCVYYTPPSPDDCTAGGYRNGEIDYYSTCSWKPTCDNGMFVCRNGSWKCEPMAEYYYWYVPAQCQVNADAGAGGAGGTGGSPGTGGTSGTGGATATGGSGGTGGTAGSGGASATGGTASTGGSAGSGGSGGTGGTAGSGGATYANNWPVIDCVNVDSAGHLNVTLSGPIDGIDNAGVSNLADMQNYVSGLTSPRICLVGETVGWFSRSYCADWQAGKTSVAFPVIQVNPMMKTKINYVIDYGNGWMIWGRNTNLSYDPDAKNLCAFGADHVNLYVKPISGS